MKNLISFLMLLLISFNIYAESVRIQVLDRGQADGILIRTPNKEWVVIDAGTSKKQAESMVNEWGVDELELAIVTHRHRDHLGGMDVVLDAIPTKLYVGINEDCPTVVSDDHVRDVINDKEIPVAALSETPVVHTIDNVRFTVLPLPPESECPGEENENSIVVRMDYGEFSMLFTGDAETEELEWLLDHHSELLDVDVLKASHHGSNNGYTDAFLEKVSPERVVISAGVNANYYHPHAQAVGAYKEASNDRLYCTNRHGTIRVYGYEDGRIRVYKQLRNDKSCVYDGTHY